MIEEKMKEISEIIPKDLEVIVEIEHENICCFLVDYVGNNIFEPESNSFEENLDEIIEFIKEQKYLLV